MALVGQSVSQVYASDFREEQRGGGARLARHYRSLLFRLIILGTLAVSGIVGVLVTCGNSCSATSGRIWATLRSI